MSSLLTAERTKYEDAWALPAYAEHAPGERYLPLFLDMAHPLPGAWVLDAGCGSGKGALALRAAGFNVRMCDVTPDGLVPDALEIPFTERCLWSDMGPVDADYVYCTDVLEHIPTALTMLVVARLLESATYGAFLSISLTPDQFGAWIGKPLHQTVQSFTWWVEHLGAVGHVVEARDLLNAGVFWVTAP